MSNEFKQRITNLDPRKADVATQPAAEAYLVVKQLSSQRESLIGVDNDEEAVNLIKFQKAFEASSRVLNISNEILSTLINLGR